MNPFRNNNGQFCTQKEYEQKAVDLAVKEWGVVEVEEPKQFLSIPPELFGGLIVVGAITLIMFIVVATYYLWVRL